MAGVVSVGELRAILTLQDHFSGPIDKIAKALGVSSQSFTAMAQFAGLAAGALTATTAAIVALGTHGADVADVQSAFNDLATAAGASAEVMLGKLQEGTLGTISNFDLMKVANKALGAGLIKSADDMGTLAQGAQLLADRTGKDTKEAFELLTSAIASGRTSQLRQLGLFVDSKVATGEFAEEIGKTTNELTGAEKAQSLSVATLEALKKQLAEGGKSSADFGDNVARGKIAVQNFVDNLGVAIATSPVVQAGMKAMGTALGQAFGGSQQDMVKTLIGWVNSFAIGLTYVGQTAVTAATVLVTAWFVAKTALLGVMTVLAMVAETIAAVVEGAAIGAASIPGLGDKMKGVAAGAEQMRVAVSGVAKDLASQTAEAAKGVVGNSDLHRSLDTLNGAFITGRAAMEAAAGSAALVIKKHQEMGPAADEAAKRSKEANDKIAETFRTLQQEIAVAQTEGISKRLLELQFDRENQIRGLRELKDLSAAEYSAMVADVNAKYDLMASKVRDDYAVQVRQAFQTLQNEISLAQTTGIANRLLEIDIAQAAELEKLRNFTAGYGMLYEALAALVKTKYEQMRAAAVISQEGIVAAANAAGFQTRAQLQETADRAKQVYDEMLKSGQFTYGELQAAHARWKEAEEKVEETSLKTKVLMWAQLAENAASIIRSLFGRSKAAAIAAAIIDTAAAVAKSLASLPWPLSLGAAAAAFAAGIAQVNVIRNTDYSAMFGSPDTRFEDFGRGTAATLHGREAVVTERQASSVAGMVEEAIARGQEGAASAGPIAQFNLQVAGATVGRVLLRRNRAGLLELDQLGA